MNFGELKNTELKTLLQRVESKVKFMEIFTPTTYDKKKYQKLIKLERAVKVEIYKRDIESAEYPPPTLRNKVNINIFFEKVMMA